MGKAINQSINQDFDSMTTADQRAAVVKKNVYVNTKSGPEINFWPLSYEEIPKKMVLNRKILHFTETMSLERTSSYTQVQGQNCFLKVCIES